MQKQGKHIKLSKLWRSAAANARLGFLRRQINMLAAPPNIGRETSLYAMLYDAYIRDLSVRSRLETEYDQIMRSEYAHA